MDEDPPVQRLRLVGGLDAQLVVEPGAQVVVGGERVGLPAHRVQRPHERHRGSFPGRVASHQCLEPGQRLGGPTQLQQRQRTVFERAGAELGQPRDRGGRELVVGELGEGLAPPQRERRVEVGQRADVVPRCGGGPSGADELLELGASSVAPSRVRQYPGGRCRSAARRSEDAAQPRDVGPKRGDGTGGHRVPPEGGHQPVGGHDLARSHDQDREQQAWLRTAERDRSVHILDLQRSEDPEAHLSSPPALSSFLQSAFLQSDCNGRNRQ